MPKSRPASIIIRLGGRKYFILLEYLENFLLYQIKSSRSKVIYRALPTFIPFRCDEMFVLELLFRNHDIYFSSDELNLVRSFDQKMAKIRSAFIRT